MTVWNSGKIWAVSSHLPPWDSHGLNSDHQAWQHGTLTTEKSLWVNYFKNLAQYGDGHPNFRTWKAKTEGLPRYEAKLRYKGAVRSARALASTYLAQNKEMGVLVHAFNPSTPKAEQWVSKFKASLVYTANYGTEV